MAKASMKKMLEAGVHFGHRSRFWHPKMEPYIYGTRNGVHIINLEKTLPQFNDVLNFASKTASQGGSILFVGTKRAASNIIKEEAIRCGMPYVNHRWLGGMMTNYKTIKASIKRLKDLEFLAEENFAQFTKKEALVMTREMEKLERSLGGIKDLGSIPDVVFVVDIGHEKNAVREARTLRLPIIGVVDSNHNPEGIDYVIAGNDDSIRAISYYARKIADAVLEAKASIVETKPAVEPVTEAAAEEKKPATEAAAEEKKPATEAAAEEKKPATEAAAEEKKPATEAAAEEKKPATEAAAEEKKPAVKKPAAKKPAAKKPAAKKPAAKKPAAKKPAAKKPAAKKPAATKAETD
ncbi:30S ribosomal protein S2 [Candidatus Pseudothioglobus singularis PS1]|uniref:Small ribosomal subunit protein uS2 n=2 Tax=Candidatus Pseudothioglobus TaxID=2841677 RepID=A0A0M5KRF3_9GAMM|nr:30S ribosomal protein S2 [Candidatus Pseudothioglobus singularis]ALE01140.1 30S ribosomal protein S2 [Candidatus Pseudothioglobus singularis PS1]